ncbi:MAG TPA: DUF1634 domain-containing protein [Candidatus Saccharimonadales bacterium]|jgi:hypothetical protein|nr:DUF1634 domain-containing protein [Candidatus Saccharimonadales bacterium]
MDGGFALPILLPVDRVIVMLIIYLRQDDYHLSAIALLVLAIIFLGFAVGLAGSNHRNTPGISDSGERRNSSTSHNSSYIANVKPFPYGGGNMLFPGQVKVKEV